MDDLSTDNGLSPARLFDLSGRVAIVTGAAGGLGHTLARGLAAAGARLFLTDMASGEQWWPDNVACWLSADLADEAACETLVHKAIEAFGRLDILVNCAAVNHRKPILVVEHADYDEIMAVNLRAPYFLSRAAARHMRESGGSIIHIGSINAAYGLAGVSVYGPAKAALSQLTRVQAVEWAPHNIRVNCLAPGFMQTPLSAPLWQDPVRANWIRSRVPLDRPGKPHELVGLLQLLASDAGSFMTGQTLYVDGGFLAGGDWDR